MTKDERMYLNDLSVKVYGKSSHWAKMVNKGEIAQLTRTLDDGTEQKYKGISYYSVEEIKNIMEEIWKEELERQATKKENQKVVEETKETGQGIEG